MLDNKWNALSAKQLNRYTEKKGEKNSTIISPKEKGLSSQQLEELLNKTCLDDITAQLATLREKIKYFMTENLEMLSITDKKQLLEYIEESISLETSKKDLDSPKKGYWKKAALSLTALSIFGAGVLSEIEFNKNNPNSTPNFEQNKTAQAVEASKIGDMLIMKIKKYTEQQKTEQQEIEKQDTLKETVADSNITKPVSKLEDGADMNTTATKEKNSSAPITKNSLWKEFVKKGGRVKPNPDSNESDDSISIDVDKLF